MMKLVFAFCAAIFVWLGYQYKITTDAIVQMQKADQELLAHSVIPYKPLNWRDP